MCALRILDLPDPITELILDDLPLPAYVRFAAVCSQWRRIQREHRLRHSPTAAPPILPNFPILIPHSFYNNRATLNCYHPTPDQGYHSSRRLRVRIPQIAPPETRIVSLHVCRGWLLLLPVINCGNSQPFLVNPVTGESIALPPLGITITFSRVDMRGAISAPPSDPDSTVLIMRNRTIFLCRVFDGLEWTRLLVEREFEVEEELRGSRNKSTAYFGGKFYCFGFGSLMEIEPHHNPPSVRFLEMAPHPLRGSGYEDYLVECCGELLLVMHDHIEYHEDEAFQVHRADFTQMKWVRVDSIGDHVVIIGTSAFSMPASDVVWRKKENCIYYSWWPLSPAPAWRVFELETRKCTISSVIPTLAKSDVNYQWFIASTDRRRRLLS